MPIAFIMCRNEECRAAKHCLRFRAIPDNGQSYNDFKPIAGSRQCGNYLAIPEGAKLFVKRERS